MAELNTNVFTAEKKFVDFAGLDYFWAKAKNYIDGVDATMSAKVVTLENTVGDSTKGLVKGLADLKTTVDALGNIEGGEGIGGMIDAKITALDLPNTYEAKGEAAKAQAAAEAYADGLAGNYEVAGAAKTAEDNAKDYADGLASNYDEAGAAAAVQGNLDSHAGDAVAHVTADERAAWNNAKTAIDTFLKDADMTEKAVDTLAELQTYMTTDGAAAAELVSRVKALEDGKDDYVDADATNLQAAKDYADGLASNYDAAGAAATAKSEAIADAASKYQVKGDYEAAGTAQGLIDGLKLSDTYEAKGAAATAQVAAIAQAKADAAEALKSYYTKTEVDNLLSTNSTGDRAYAKQYTDELFASFKFAANSDIDALFAAKAE